jgi:4-amino-4-deoxy-L-arabinose transferase-like glycosyltransferase
MNKQNVLVLGVIVLVGVVHLATLRAGHEWGDDFSLYVAHARNLAEGRAYADTGYVYNPRYPSLSPRSYPPVFPLLLAPVYAIFGLNLAAMKAAEVLIFLTFLWVLSVGLRRRLTPPYVAAVLLLVGLNPLVWQAKDRLLSETPFMMFTYLALFLLDRGYDEEDAPCRPWLWGLLGGAAAYLAFGTRTIGLVFLPTILVYELLRRRRPGAVTFAAAAAFLVGVGLQRVLVPADASYLDQLVLDPMLYLRTALSLVRAEGWFVANGYSGAAAAAVYLGLLVLACPAYLARLRGRLTVYEVFPVFYFLLLVFWPFAELEARYLIPLLPLSFLYVAEALQGMDAGALRRLKGPAVVLTAAALLATYAARFTTVEAGSYRQGVSAPETVALFDYIKANTGPTDVFIFQKPRALALYTGRRSSAVQKSPDEDGVWRCLSQSHASYVVLCPQFESSRKVLKPFIERHPDAFEQVYSNPQFTLYHVRDDGVTLR